MSGKGHKSNTNHLQGQHTQVLVQVVLVQVALEGLVQVEWV